MPSRWRVLLVLVGVAILALDYAALDDITTGNQPHFYWEWFFLLASVPLLMVVGRQWRHQ